jgi:uncharacterized cupin superfamily protein
MGKRHANVVNVEDIAADEQGQGGFGSRRRRLSPDAGGRALGCSHFELLPGQTAFPFHWHSSQEESIFILEGSGQMRVGKDTVDVRAGDYIGLPPGPDMAHALTNNGSAPLRYLCFSATATPVSLDIVAYPDSKKVAYACGVDPVKGFRGGAWLLKIVDDKLPTLGYYDGETLAEKK